MEFRILGPLEVRDRGAAVALGGSRQRAVLAALLLRANETASISYLAEAVWETPPATPASNLRTYVSGLRQRLRESDGGPSRLSTRPGGYALSVAAHELDLATFDEHRAAGDRALRDGDLAGAAGFFDQALRLWRGRSLEGQAAGPLLRAELTRLEEHRLAVVERHTGTRLELGQHADLVGKLRRLVADHPLREELWGQLMLALHRSGRRAEALNTYQQVYRMLDAELGVAPGQALRELHGRLLADAPAPRAASPDRGPRQLPPQTDHYTGREEVLDKLPGLQQRITPLPRQLPPATAALTGRDKLVDEISAELRGGDGGAGPVVVLIGAGGVGKTAVALAAAHRVGEAFPDGHLYADLRGSHPDPVDPHAVIGRFLRTLGVPEPSLPIDPDERLGLYRSHLADRRMLIVVDDAAGEQQLRPLLPGTVGCGVLVTSRRPLGAMVGAARWTVPVLAPDDAVQLLATVIGPQRAADDPDAVAAITDLCGRLPLAVCVAAGRLAVRPEWTLDGFRQRLAMQRGRLDELTLGDLDVRASIALSYQALDPPLRRLLRRLGWVSAADWPSWVAMELVDESSLAWTVRMLDQLVEVHLVEPLGLDPVGQPRFRLHDLVGDFARERALAEETPVDRAEAQSRVLSGWLALVSNADERLGHGRLFAAGLAVPERCPDVTSARARPAEWLEVERAGLTDAVDQACQLGRAELAGMLALRLAGFFSLRSWDDWERTLRQATTAVREHGSNHLLLLLVATLSVLYSQQSRNGELRTNAVEQLTLARRLGDRTEQGRALVNSGLAARKRGRLAEATCWFEQAVDTCDPATPTLLAAIALFNLADTHWEAGQHARALPLAERALDLHRRVGNPTMIGSALVMYALVLFDVGRVADAERALTEELDVIDDMTSAYITWVLATVDLRQGRWESAAHRLGEAVRVHDKLGCQDGVGRALLSLGDLAAGQGRPQDALDPLRRALTIWRGIGQPLDAARALARLELALRAVGNSVEAAACGDECRSILIDLGLDDRCLHLPPFGSP